MRLIDADALKEDLLINHNTDLMSQSLVLGSGFDVGVDYVMLFIEDAPTIEPKQGEWIKHDKERDYCSVCKHIFKTRTLTKQDKWTTYVDDLGYNFCPNCGARMVK